MNRVCIAWRVPHDRFHLVRMNIHHLELFYHVARHGGISAAVRHMPYGIQQPAVSSQIRQLEEHLGVKLFERQPFQLTQEGEELIEFAGPFFDHVDRVGAALGRRARVQVRIGASEVVLRDHMPAVMQRVKKRYPGLRIAMQDGPQAQLQAQIRNRELDLAISTGVRPRPGSGLRALRMMQVPLVLLVHRKSGIKSAADLWSCPPIEEALITSTPSPEDIFQQGLKQRGIQWRAAIEATSLEMVTWYVAHGHGVGLSIALPQFARHRDVRVLPLEGFEPVEIILIVRGEPSPVIGTLIDEALLYVRQTWPEFACERSPQGEHSSKRKVRVWPDRRRQ